MSFIAGGGGSGIIHAPHKWSRAQRPAKKRTSVRGRNLPALAFVAPYHELLMRNLLKMDEVHSAKTRKSNWHYRGTVLLYTSKGKPHQVPVRAYSLELPEIPKGVIVGVATMTDCRELTWDEKVLMTQNFNDFDRERAESNLSTMDIYGETQDNCILPLPFGIFLKDIKRFDQPIEFKPRPGAIGIMRVPLRKVARALREVDIDPKTLETA